MGEKLHRSQRSSSAIATMRVDGSGQRITLGRPGREGRGLGSSDPGVCSSVSIAYLTSKGGERTSSADMERQVYGILGSDVVRTLLAVSEEANITRASECLGLTQQAVSAQIKRLERLAGCRLIERHGKGVRITREGEAMLAYARQMAEIDRRVRNHFSHLSVSGSIRIGLVEGFAATGLPSVLAALRASQPDLDITVEAAATDRLLARIDDRRLDVVIGLQRQGQSRGERLLTDHLCWFGDAECFADASRPVRLLLHPEPSFARSIVIETMTRSGRPYAIQFESNSRESLRAAAIAGLGMAALFRSFEHEAPPPAPSGLPELGTAELFMRADRTDDEAVRLFADLIRDCATSVLRERADHP